jgi:hypothetical protein
LVTWEHDYIDCVGKIRYVIGVKENMISNKFETKRLKRHTQLENVSGAIVPFAYCDRHILTKIRLASHFKHYHGLYLMTLSTTQNYYLTRLKGAYYHINYINGNNNPPINQSICLSIYPIGPSIHISMLFVFNKFCVIF